ncbi:MAG: hypothetical protein HQ592_18550 [Planctomycetes bacterium]|nr:hypothetical protein [Planctomycetota bacterium]
MSWTRTFSGKKFHLFDPKPEQVCLEDVAWHLSNICRWGGACEFFSVAQHSIMVSQLLPPEFALDGLLHDAHEAYLGDVVEPLKQYLRGGFAPEALLESIYDRRAGIVQAVICEALGVAWPPSDDVLAMINGADLLCRAAEERDLFEQRVCGCVPEADPMEVADVAPIIPLRPFRAREMFCSRWRYLRGEAEKKL